VDSAGGFFASQQADDLYYGTEADNRATLDPPRIDRVRYSGPNGEMAQAYVRAAELLGDSSLLEFAAATLERIVGETYDRGHGLAHWLDDIDGVRGLLADQVPVSEALLDLFHATDRAVYLDLAQELMLYAMRTLLDDHSGRFVDPVVHAADVGLLRQPIAPFDLNCRAAHVLARLSRQTDRTDFAERARGALGSQTVRARSQGVEAASYVLAMRDVEFPKSS